LIDETGQAIVPAVVAIGLLIMLLWTLMAVAMALDEHTAVQSAVDAAALACASTADLRRTVDARGVIYAQTVEIPVAAGTSAARVVWDRNMLGHGVRLQSISVQARGDLCAVHVTVDTTMLAIVLGRAASPLRWQAHAFAEAVPLASETRGGRR